MKGYLARVLRGLARRIDPREAIAASFMDARQNELGGLGPIDLEAVIRAAVRGDEPFCFVQIGAHDGSVNDPLAASIAALGLRGVMIEPQSHEYERLVEKYGGQPGIAVERAAIAHHDGEVTLYKVKSAFWESQGYPQDVASQISSLNRHQIGKHVALFGGDALAGREDDYLELEIVPALTLRSLIARHRLGRIDLLQIDAEGFDFEIVKMIDWSNPPRLVHFETVHLPVEDRVEAWALLRSKGYALFASDDHNTLAILEARRAMSATPTAAAQMGSVERPAEARRC